MIKLSWMLLKSRKKFVITIISILTLSGIMSLLSYSLAETNFQQKKEMAQKIYGSYVCGICDIASEDIEKTKTNSDVISGLYTSDGEVTGSDNSKLSVGYGDSCFWKLANVKVLKGRIPIAENEVAIEQFTTELLGVTDIGQTIELEVGGIKKTAVVSAIVRNYSNLLNTCDRLEKGINHYPNILCSTDYSNDLKACNIQYSVLLGYKNNDDIKASQIATLDHMHSIISSMGFDDSYDIFDNDNLYISGLTNCESIINFSILFITLTIASGLAGVSYIQYIFLKDYRKKMAVFATCGMQKGRIKRIVMSQIGFVVGIGLILMAIIAIILSLIFSACGIGITLLCRSNITFLCLWSMLCTICISAVSICSTRMKEDSIYTYLSTANRNMAGAQIWKSGTNIKKKLSSINIETLCWNTMLFLFFIIVFYSIHTVKNDFSDYPDYYLMSRDVVTKERVHGYAVEYNMDKCIPKDFLHKGTDNIFLETDVNIHSHTLLLPADQNNQYFSKWIANHTLEDTAYKKSISKNWPVEANNYIPVPDVDVLALTNEQFGKVCSKYRVDNSDLNGVLLFLPDASDKDAKGVLGNKITVGGLKFKDNSVGFDKTDFTLDDVVLSNYKMEWNGIEQERDSITIVVSQKLLDLTQSIQGFNQIQVYETSESSVDDARIGDEVNKAMNRTEGGMLYTKKATQRDEEQYVDYVHLCGSFATIITLILLVMYFYIRLFQLLIAKKRTWGILLTLGLSKTELVKLLFYSDLKSTLFSFALSGAMINAFLQLNIIETLPVLIIVLSFVGLLLVCVTLECLISYKMKNVEYLQLIDKEF